MRYDVFTKRLVDAVLEIPGDTPTEVRRAAMQRTALPVPLAQYVDKVARHAYKVTDADLAALQQSGHSDDSLFEITVAAAVGAAMIRLNRGMAALRGSGGEPD